MLILVGVLVVLMVATFFYGAFSSMDFPVWSTEGPRRVQNAVVAFIIELWVLLILVFAVWWR